MSVTYHAWSHRPREVGGTDPGPPVGRFVIKVFADADALDGNLPASAVVVSAGDGKVVFHVPPDLDGTRLFVAEAGVSAVGSGDLEVTLYNLDQSVDMLTSPITIGAGDYASFPPAATAIDTANNKVAAGDRISINVDADGTTAEGLEVHLSFG